MKKNLTGIFLFVLAAAVFSQTSAAGYRSPISVEIKMKKAVFELYEPVEGEVVLNNRYPASVPVTLHVKLYRQGELHYQGLTNVETVFTGTTRVPLKNMGIPDINDNPDAVGRWHISILQQNVDPSQAARTSFKIKKSKNKPAPDKTGPHTSRY